MPYKKIFFLVIGITLLFSGFALSQDQLVSFSSETGPNTQIWNIVNFGGLPAQDGWIIQIICVGPDHIIQPPVLSGPNIGMPTGDDFLADPAQNLRNSIHFYLDYTGVSGAFVSEGGMKALAAGAGTEPVINIGDEVYLRAFNSTNWTTATLYADLLSNMIHTVVLSGPPYYVYDCEFTPEMALPVEMLSFSANPGNNFVTLDWATASETENDHFNIYRDDVKIAQIPSLNLSGEAVETDYNFKDEQVTNGIAYLYEITAVDINGEETEALYNMEVIPSWDPDYIVSDYLLHQNYPNPFNPGTTIEYDVLESGKVYLSVFNIQGQEVAKIINGEYRVGPLKHVSFWNADGLSSGIYFYQVRVNDFKSTKKMVLVR